jgi:hypothetical protein
VSKVEEIERIIEQLPPEDFEKLSAWVEQRRRDKRTETYPEPAKATMTFRDHSAFLSGYSPEDEGIYDDAGSR